MLTTQLFSSTRNTEHGGDRAFFYVDGIPTKGIWIDLENVESWTDIHDVLAKAGVTESDHDGDILVADVEGPLIRACYSSRYDLIDLRAYITLRDDVTRLSTSDEAVVAFINWYGSWDADAFESAYMGQYDSPETFAEQYLDDTGMLSDVPEHLQCYFDVELFARDLFQGDYYFDDGFVFCSNC